MSEAEHIEAARELLAGARAVLVTAGAGMGVDSGLPDFRGDEGFWNAYPPYRGLGVSFVEMANPGHFAADPEFGWGFYGHRLELYRKTPPHEGFGMIHRFASALEGGCFVFTSNVDGHFQRAGFDPARVVECHGSINHLQCSRSCGEPIWDAGEIDVAVELETMRATPPLPSCPGCGALARPNVLMFGDFGWEPQRTLGQERRYRDWLTRWAGDGLVVLEFGAGTAVPTVRMESERIAAAGRGLVRVNPREPERPRGLIGAGLSLGGIDACRALFTG